MRERKKPTVRTVEVSPDYLDFVFSKFIDVAPGDLYYLTSFFIHDFVGVLLFAFSFPLLPNLQCLKLQLRQDLGPHPFFSAEFSQ